MYVSLNFDKIHKTVANNFQGLRLRLSPSMDKICLLHNSHSHCFNKCRGNKKKQNFIRISLFFFLPIFQFYTMPTKCLLMAKITTFPIVRRNMLCMSIEHSFLCIFCLFCYQNRKIFACEW